jgi:NitT/TauT family transport system substrate-binding protein
MMKQKWVFAGLLVALLVGLLGCGGGEADPEGLRRLRLPMGFIADPQYAPLYVAVERGYFAEEGLELDFDYSFETDGIALVGANNLPLAIVSGEQVILARAQGLPVVYVMAWWQRNPIALVSQTEANIKTPQDLLGRKVGLPGFWGASYVGYVGLLTANGLTQEQVDADDIGFNQIESLLAGQSESVVIYVNNEPTQLEAAGISFDMIEVADYINLLANGIITNEQTLAENPELVQGFLRAMLRGLADALADPEAAYEISKKYVEGLDDSRYPVLLASLELWRGEPLGQIDPAAWTQTQDILLEMGFLDAPLADLDAAYTDEWVLRAQP